MVSGMLNACEGTSELGPAIDLSLCHPGNEGTTGCGQTGRQRRRREKVVWPQGEKHTGQRVALGGHGVALLSEVGQKGELTYMC